MTTPLTPPPTAPSRSMTNDEFVVAANAMVAWYATQYAELTVFAAEMEALAGAAFTGTSTTSLAIGTGSKSFTTQTGLSFSAGQFIVAASASGPTNYMVGNITSYNTGTGALVMNSTAVGGSGTMTDWALGLIPTTAGVLIAGSTMTGQLVLPAATTSLSPLRIPHGTAHSAPTDGDLWTTSTGLYARINGATVLFSTLAQATASQVWTGTSQTTAITPYALFQAADAVALSDGATITPNFNTGLNFTVTLGGNRTLANPTNAKDGQSGLIIVSQDGTGSRTLSYGANYRFPGGAAASGVLSTTASAKDIIAYHVEGGLIYCSLQKAFAA